MSDELAQDDDGFEIRSLADSLDEEEGRTPDDRVAVPDGAPDRGISPNTASNASAAAPSPRLRESLDGETIFAVGEDGDKWSDEDESPRNSEERKRLTGKTS